MRFWTYLLVPLLISCERYQVTVNTQTVYTPPQLFAGFTIKDPGLNNCVAQTIKDNSIRNPESLTSLLCSHAGIENIDGIEIFTKLSTVNLENNNLRQVKPLLFLGYLERVGLSGNKNLDCQDAASLKALSVSVTVPKHC